MRITKTAIVTGAAKGIGQAIAKKLIQDGFFVWIIDIDETAGEKFIKQNKQDTVKFIKGDISEEIQVQHIFELIIKENNAIDVLVNNAGIIRDNLIHNMPVEDFDIVLNVNLKGTWLMCKEAAKIMRVQKKGRIINISSRAWLGNRGQSNYSASKAGIISLTKVLALELGKYNVFVNAIAPGLIDTPLTQFLNKEVLDQLIQTQPTRTMGNPEDVANAVSFLASEKTKFITGQVLYVDGGKSIGAGM